MISNCNLYAWRQFLLGKTESITLHSTEWSRWRDIAKHRAWRYTLRPLGGWLGYLAWLLVQAAWWCQRGQWAHVTTDTTEFVPVEQPSNRWCPSPVFKGHVRPITQRDKCKKCGFRKRIIEGL